MQDISEAEGEKFANSCAEAARYPTNLIYDDNYDHVLKDYVERLDEQDDRMFFDESKASLSLRDFHEGVKCFENITLCTNVDLQDYLTGKMLLERTDPQCRFVFVHAPHSRERLKVTRTMLLFTFTYHQVMPTFLDFLFSFVEPSKGQKEWPWSIRQTASYHSFDIETGKAFWVIIKGDQLMKRRIEAATKTGSPQTLKSFDSLAASFASTLQAHLIIFDWCREHWRWYINFLEQELQSLTRETLLVEFERSPTRIERAPSQGRVERMTSQICSSPTSVSEKRPWRFGNQVKQPAPFSPTQGQSIFNAGPPSSFGESQDSLSLDDNFSFSDLQKVQSLEEKANETCLILESNINTLSEVKQHYREVVASEEFSRILESGCARDLSRFEKAVANIVSDLQMQQSRTKMLLRLLMDRKSLLYGILDYRNMESNKLFAGKAQLSSENMELLTRDMHEIAQKTKQETVSMRIITLVTLFFLPGTFISTIMSTDIVQYQMAADGKSQEIFQLGALQLYLAITIPMMFLTFASWYGVYFWVDRKEKAKEIEKQLKSGA